MILKPFSVSMNVNYREFISQNYFVVLPDHGLKRVNLKGVNKISKENDPDFKELEEKDLIPRKFDEMNLTSELINEGEKSYISDQSKKRLESSEKDKCADINFISLGAVFSFEMLDIVWLNEMENAEVHQALDVIKDSLIFSGKGDLNEKFKNFTQMYSKYLENPSDKNQLSNIKSGIEECIKNYQENPFSHILLGMIYLRPTIYFDLNKAYDEFLSAKKYSLEIENHYLLGCCNFVLAWISYIKKDTNEAIEFSQEAIDNEFMNIPEIYFNLAKFYASLNDHENALKLLDEVINRFDLLYAIKADIDNDFNLIKGELIKYFIRIRDEEKSKMLDKLNSLGIDFTNSADVKETETASSAEKT